MSGDLGELSEELQSLQALRRSSSGSRCIHEHHCGSQVSVNSLKGGQGAHSLGRGSMELPSFRGDFQSSLPPLGDLSSSLRKKSWPSMKPGRMQGHHVMGDRVMGRQDRVMEEDEEDDEDGRNDVYVRRGGSRRGNFEMAQQRSLSMDFWGGKTRLTRCAETTFNNQCLTSGAELLIQHHRADVSYAARLLLTQGLLQSRAPRAAALPTLLRWCVWWCRSLENS